MDLSYDGENNFNLPDPAGRLDFTEDEDVNRKNDQCGGDACAQSCDQQCDEADVSMNDEQADESESDIEESAAAAEPIEFNKPLVNQNLMLNRKPGNGPSSRFAGRQATGLQEPVTPALIKRKQFKQWFNSPTDSCLSPCTQKIFKQKKPI